MHLIMKTLNSYFWLVFLALLNICEIAVAQPVIVNPPNSEIGFIGYNASVTVAATDANPLSFQWMAGAIGSGVYTNILNGGQFSGSTSATLVISNSTAANQADYVVVVSASDGNVTSTPPATLTMLNLVYYE